MSQIKLTYFDFPGRAEAIRLAFHIGGVQFEDERLSPEEFGKQKEAGRFKYGQIPVLEIDGVQYAQSGAIFRYASQKSGLLPSDEQERLLVEDILFSITEIEDALIPTLKLQDKEEIKKARENFLNTVLLKWFKFFNQQLEKSGTGFLVGKQLTAADVYTFLMVRSMKSGVFEHIPADVTKDFELLEKHFQQVSQVGKIQEYIQKK